MDQTLNANFAECIKAATSLGHTTYYNICNHTETVVPWGSADWLGACAIGAVITAFILIMGSVVYMLIAD